MGTNPKGPVIVVGAARSGTKIVRDTVTSLPGFETWPCDEIPAIWKHGNLDHPNDELRPEHARPQVRSFIRSRFRDQAPDEDVSRLVEKTCANSLRVGFVDEVWPEARYVFIVRDGRDVVASAMDRWRADLDLVYTLRKARYVPFSDIPWYAWQFLRTRAGRWWSGESQLPLWGPHFEGMEAMARESPLSAVCAEQWTQCVETSREALASIDDERVLELRYERFVQEPAKHVERLADFLDVDRAEIAPEQLAEPVRADSVGRWSSDLDEDQQRHVIEQAGRILERHGYR